MDFSKECNRGAQSGPEEAVAGDGREVIFVVGIDFRMYLR
jgi:hypothetical protein